MYIERIPNRNSPPAILLREAWREGKKIRKRTVANLSRWPEDQIEALGRVLKGEGLLRADEGLSIEASVPHGHVEAILGLIRKVGLDRVICPKKCRERELVLGMVVERLIDPCSKLATTRLWHSSTLSKELGVGDADEDDLYTALDWLLARQSRIEKKLSERHLCEGAVVLYDVTSSYYEGRKCPLARLGHNRDGKKGKPIIVYGMVTDQRGCPVAVDVYPGNTGDPSTVVDQVKKLRADFGLLHVVLVGDRGMLTQTQLDKIKGYPGLGWISALRSCAIRKLVQSGSVQMSLFDEKEIAEIHAEDFPGERLVACHNPILADERRRKREELLEATKRELKRIEKEVARRRKKILNKADIGKKVGRVLNRFKVGKHFDLKIQDGLFSFSLKEESIRRESEMDGIYVIRTSESSERMSPEEVVRSYKDLEKVERAFRSLKGIDLLVRPIYHRTEPHVRAHILLCMLAYYVEWHMRSYLAELLFEDEELAERRRVVHPVRPRIPSVSAKRKKTIRLSPDGLPVQSLHTLLSHLATRCRVLCRLKGTTTGGSTFTRLTEMTPLQKKAFTLLGCCQ